MCALPVWTLGVRPLGALTAVGALTFDYVFLNDIHVRAFDCLLAAYVFLNDIRIRAFQIQLFAAYTRAYILNTQHAQKVASFWVLNPKYTEFITQNTQGYKPKYGGFKTQNLWVYNPNKFGL